MKKKALPTSFELGEVRYWTMSGLFYIHYLVRKQYGEITGDCRMNITFEQYKKAYDLLCRRETE